MREILFRGKRKDDGEWVYGNLVHQTEYYGDPVDRYHILECREFDADYYNSAEVIPETVGQFTGLYDSNRVKIFEGDIVKPKLDSVFYSNCSKIHVVEWINNSCGFEPYSDSRENCGHCGGGEMPEWTTIIGNIHDNPELLEEKNGSLDN